MNYEQHKDQLEWLTPEQREAIQHLCVWLYKNSWFQIFFEYYTNKFVTDCILDIQTKRQRWVAFDAGKLPDGVELLQSIQDEIIQIAGLTEELALEETRAKKEKQKKS